MTNSKGGFKGRTPKAGAPQPAPRAPQPAPRAPQLRRPIATPVMRIAPRGKSGARGR